MIFFFKYKILKINFKKAVESAITIFLINAGVFTGGFSYYLTLFTFIK